jgi:ABC-2 type transport system permease protein
MTARGLSATAARVLAQLRRDPRTVALVLLVPCLLLTLLKYLFYDQPETFDRIGVPLVGLFPFLQLFIVTSVTMLRERSSGTLERLMASPIAKLDLLAGYAAAFALLAALQATIVAGFALTALGLDTSANAPTVIALAVANALLGMSLGLLASAFARTEFQTVQFMPAFILPQLLLCGLFVPPRAHGRGAPNTRRRPSRHLRLRRPRPARRQRRARPQRHPRRRRHPRPHRPRPHPLRGNPAAANGLSTAKPLRVSEPGRITEHHGACSACEHRAASSLTSEEPYTGIFSHTPTVFIAAGRVRPTPRTARRPCGRARRGGYARRGSTRHSWSTCQS